MTNYFLLAQGQAGVKTQTVQQAAVQTAGTVQQADPKQAGARPQGQPGAFGDMTSLGIMVIIIGAMFFLMWRGQSKERKKRENMLSSLKKGDRIVTIGGMFATVAEVREKSYLVDLSDKVRIEVTKAAVGSVVSAEEGADKK